MEVNCIVSFIDYFSFIEIHLMNNCLHEIVLHERLYQKSVFNTKYV
jgi:hypothetical protein